MSIQDVRMQESLSEFAAPGAAGPVFHWPAPASLAPANDAAFLARDWAHGMGKRLIDLLVAVPALVLLAPVLLLTALAIRLDSRGPVLFRQARLGRDGKPFRIFKFRTMKVLEDGAHVVQAARGDARITAIGRWLRVSSLDELPQLLNVVRGEMSLVGPRPHAAAHDRHYARLIRGYNGRQAVKPGLTGWAQVNGLRGATPELEDMEKRVACDLWYARHASFALDLLILLRTPFEVLHGRNAF